MFTTLSRTVSRVSKRELRQAWPWLSEFIGVVPSRFRLSRATIFTAASLIKPEDSVNPLFKAILYSGSWVRQLVNMHDYDRTVKTPSYDQTGQQVVAYLLGGLTWITLNHTRPPQCTAFT